MNKKRLIELIQHPEKINQKDVQELEDLVREYPYFQNAYFLIAKGNGQLKSLGTSASIQRAAVFAPDRTQLKKYLTDLPQQKAKETKEETIDAGQAISSEDQEPVFAFTIQESELISFDVVVEEESDSEKLMEELRANLKKLHNTKEELATAEKDFKKQQDKNKEPKAPVKKKAVSKTAPAVAPKVKPETSSKKKQVEKKPSPKAKPKASKPEPPKVEEKAKVEKKSPVKGLPKEEQIKIIEQFIESSPQIPKVAHGTITEAHHDDLSSQIKYDMEDFITENLAIIMEKQGKTDKAIEIYNKLIWKFPQKKAYFATQIEKIIHK